MPNPLEGIRAKLQRANEHIKQINDDIIVHRKIRIPSNCVRAQIQGEMGRINDPSTHRKRVVFYLKGASPPLDLSFTILAGEAVHQLRSVLDHLAYQLVIAKTKQPPMFNSAFPIVGKGRMKKKVWVSAPDEYAAQIGRLKQDISAHAETLIQGLQPFKRGAAYDEDPLWTLSELDNAYKHRLLLLAVHRVTNYWVTVTSRGIVLKSNFAPNIRYEDGAEIGRIEITDPGFSIANLDVYVDGDLAVDVAFDKVIDKRDESVINCLSRLAKTVEDVVNIFVPSEFP